MGELIERAGALARIQALLDDAQEGRGRCALVEGEAGIGKTALLSAAGRRARERGMRVLGARCARLERAHVFGTVRQLFAPVLRDPTDPRDGLFAGAAELAAPLLLADATPTAAGSPGESDYATLHGLYWLLANLAERAPVLLAVDDAQWSDLPSLRWLDFLVRRLDGLAVALLVAARSDAGEPEHPALAILRDGLEAERIEPSPLSLAGVRLLVAEHIGGDGEPALAPACRQATRGNPFYLHALLRDLVGTGEGPAAASAERVRTLAPRDVTRMVARRLEPLPAAATAIAEAVAVLGDGVAVADAATLARLDAQAATEAAESLARVGILAGSEALAFVHPLVRAALSDGLGARRRAERHGAAALLLADRGADPGAVAAHLMLASRGLPGTVLTLRAAATAALSRGAPELAAAYLERALEEPLDPVGRHEVLIKLGGAETRAGMPTAAARFEAAIAHAPGPDQRGQAASHLSRLLMVQGRMPDAVRVLEQGIAEAADAPERVARLEADLVLLADIDLAARPLVDARLRQAMVEGTSPFVLGHRAIELVCAGTCCLSAGDLAEAALADGTLLAKSVVGVQHYFAMVFVLTVSGRFAAAARHVDAGLELARRRGAAIPFVTGSAQRALLAAHGGAVSGAEADARAALEVAQLNGWPPLAQMAMTGLIDALLQRDEPEQAAAELAASGLDAVSGSETVQDTVLLEARGRLRIALAELEAGVADLLEAGRRLLAWEMGNPAPFGWRSAAALGLARLGQRERALSLAREELALARVWGEPRTLGLALRRTGLIIGAEEGIAMLREAAAVLAPSGAELERARALTELGAALRRTNCRAEARTTLREALALARACESEGLTQRAHTELWATGARPRTPLRTGLESLTPSERRVAEMAAAGRSNPAIAQALFVTVKTIEMHLSSAYRRLGISGRGELASALSAPSAS